MTPWTTSHIYLSTDNLSSHLAHHFTASEKNRKGLAHSQNMWKAACIVLESPRLCHISAPSWKSKASRFPFDTSWREWRAFWCSRAGCSSKSLFVLQIFCNMFQHVGKKCWVWGYEESNMLIPWSWWGWMKGSQKQGREESLDMSTYLTFMSKQGEEWSEYLSANNCSRITDTSKDSLYLSESAVLIFCLD